VADNTKQQPHALISLYAKLYTEKYNKTVMINRYKEKWAMQEVIDSVGYDRAKELIEYYFKLTSKQGHQLQWFYYNFDRLDDMLIKTEMDNERRNMLLLKTKQMVEEGGI
jgi:hypothetical protein